MMMVHQQINTPFFIFLQKRYEQSGTKSTYVLATAFIIGAVILFAVLLTAAILVFELKKSKI